MTRIDWPLVFVSAVVAVLLCCAVAVATKATVNVFTKECP